MAKCTGLEGKVSDEDLKVVGLKVAKSVTIREGKGLFAGRRYWPDQIIGISKPVIRSTRKTESRRRQRYQFNVETKAGGGKLYKRFKGLSLLRLLRQEGE